MSVDIQFIKAVEDQSRLYLEQWIRTSFPDDPDIVLYVESIIEWLDDLDKNCSPYIYRIMPFVFARDLGVDDKYFLQNICTASLLGFIISIINDRALDENDRQKYPVRWVYISFILYAKYIVIVDQLRRNIGDDIEKNYDFLKPEREAFIGLFNEDKNHFNFELNNYKWTDVSFRCSQMKTLMNLSAIKSKIIDWRDVDKFCDLYSFAMCLEDDLFDWEEDFDNGRFTYAIQFAMNDQNIEYNKKNHDLIKKKICKIIFFSPVYFKIRNEMGRALDECLILAENMSKELKRMVIESRSVIDKITLDHIEKLKNIEKNFAAIQKNNVK